MFDSKSAEHALHEIAKKLRGVKLLILKGFIGVFFYKKRNS